MRRWRFKRITSRTRSMKVETRQMPRETPREEAWLQAAITTPTPQESTTPTSPRSSRTALAPLRARSSIVRFRSSRRVSETWKFRFRSRNRTTAIFPPSRESTVNPFVDLLAISMGGGSPARAGAAGGPLFGGGGRRVERELPPSRRGAAPPLVGRGPRVPDRDVLPPHLGEAGGGLAQPEVVRLRDDALHAAAQAPGDLEVREDGV